MELGSAHIEPEERDRGCPRWDAHGAWGLEQLGNALECSSSFDLHGSLLLHTPCQPSCGQTKPHIGCGGPRAELLHLSTWVHRAPAALRQHRWASTMQMPGAALHG